MLLPIFGQQPAEEEGLTKGHKKPSNPKSRLKSLIPNLTPTHRALVFVVIVVLFLAIAHNLSVFESPQPSLKFHAGDYRIVENILSKTYARLPNKGRSKSSSKTFAKLPDKFRSQASLPKVGVLDRSSTKKVVPASKTHFSLAKEDVAVKVSSTSYDSLPDKGRAKASLDRSSTKDLSNEVNVSNKGRSKASLDRSSTKDLSNEVNVSNKGRSKASLDRSSTKDLSNEVNVSSTTSAKLDVLNVSSTTKGVATISSEAHGNLPEKECDSGRIYVYELPAMFNYDIMNNCTQIVPPHDKCDKNLNDGFGPTATEFAGTLPESILPAFYWTDLYWGEVVFHNRMLNHKCRTREPGSAAAFYVPFYAGLALSKHLFGYSARERDWHSEMLIKWLQEQKWWNRSNGYDHFIMFGRMTWDFRRREDSDDWGTRLLNMPEMKNVVRISVERSEWDKLEVAVPYPSIFHPRSESDVTEWQEFLRSRRRSRLFSYVGGGRPKFKHDFREILKNKCLADSTACRHVDCSSNNCVDGKTAIMAAFLDADFCLQPKGDGMTRRSVFDCMVAGSIPVFFWTGTAYLQYEFAILPEDPKSYSVFIDHNDVRNGTDIRTVLERFGREEVERMREKVIEYIPRFGYARPSRGLERTRDAFDVAVDGVLNKYKDHMARGRVGNLNEM